MNADALSGAVCVLLGFFAAMIQTHGWPKLTITKRGAHQGGHRPNSSSRAPVPWPGGGPPSTRPQDPLSLSTHDQQAVDAFDKMQREMNDPAIQEEDWLYADDSQANHVRV